MWIFADKYMGLWVLDASDLTERDRNILELGERVNDECSPFNRWCYGDGECFEHTTTEEDES